MRKRGVFMVVSIGKVGMYFVILSIVVVAKGGCSGSTPGEKREVNHSYTDEGRNISGNLVLCREDYAVKYEDGRISLSRDGGKSFRRSIFVGDKYLGHIHVFENETLFFSDHTKCYYSHDWKTLHESAVLDIHGEAFRPHRYHNFSASMGSDTHRQIIGGEEMLCWGNYDYQYDTQYNNINVWYTADKGETVKSAYKFRGTEADDGSGRLFTRHVHYVNFNPGDRSFWVSTGDYERNGVDQRHVLRGRYDLKRDEWDWKVVGTGLAYKWSSAVFIGNYIYFSLDHSRGGVGRVLYDDADDENKHELILKTPNDCLTVIRSHEDELIAIQAPFGGDDDSRTFYYSPDRETWHRIRNTVPAGAANIAFLADMSTDDWGRVRATPVVMFPTHEVLPALFLDEILRRAGFPDAFKPLALVPTP